MAHTTVVLCPPGSFLGCIPPEPGLCAQGWGARSRDGEVRERMRVRLKEEKKGDRWHCLKTLSGSRTSFDGDSVLYYIKHITIPH